MRLSVLGSGSKANGYVLQNDTEALILECGCPVHDCLRVLQFDTKKVAGCFVTHEHGDHSRHIEKYMAYFPVFCSDGTSRSISYKGKRRPNVLEPLKSIQIGNFVVRPFETEHDCAEPFGYLIKHPEIGTLVFATDTYFVRYNFDGLTNVMIECNYDEDVLNDNVKKGIIQPFRKERTLRSHMSLRNCINMLRANDLSNVSQVVLLHLSEDNAEPERFAKEVALSIGKRVVVAEKGLDIAMNTTPF